MAYRKEIIVLSGGGHKGVVKLKNAAGKTNILEGVCSMDYSPADATLYLVGDKITQIALNQRETAFTTSDCDSKLISCVVKTDYSIMFGSNGNPSRGAIMSRIEDYIKQSKLRADTPPSHSDKKDRIQSENATEGNSAYNYSPDDAHNIDLNKELKPDYKTNNQNDVDDNNDLHMQSIIDLHNDKPDHILEEKNNPQSDSVQARVKKQSVRESTVKPNDWVKYDGNNFYLAVKPQLDEMFVCYPAEEQLNQSVPNSQWVRVDATDGFYVVGLLFDGDSPSYICYGVPAGQGDRPPQEIESMCVWLPIGESEGYWVIYQSAYTGDIIK